MDGYYGMPEATLAAFRNLWFHTGDLLQADADGYFYFVGRRKDIVRRRGENISAAEVEMGIETHPDVLECAVIGVPSEHDRRRGHGLRRAARTAADARATSRWPSTARPAWRASWCRATSASCAELPKTPTDKVEKFRLRSRASADTWDREMPCTRPQT